MISGSLRKILIKRLSLSFGFTLLLLVPLIYQLIEGPASDAYDHDVTDSTLSLISHVHMIDGKSQFYLSPEAEQVLRADSRDNIYYLVLGPDRRLIAGDADLPVGKALEALQNAPGSVMYSGVYRGRKVRISAMQRRFGKQNYLFLTAETTQKRDVLAVNSAVATLLAFFVLVMMATGNIWHSIRRALAPLDHVRTALHNMQYHDLKRLDDAKVPSEIQPLVQEFNALLQRLDSSMEAQQRFVANAAHQLRTPLAGVRTQLELLRREVGGGPHVQRISQSIDAIARLGHLVHQMLALLSSVPGGRQISTKAMVDVAELIRDRSGEWVRLATPREVDLGFELEPAMIHGDPLLIGEMVANLVDNAIRYSPVGTTVMVRCRHDGSHVVIEVEDNGPGIPVDQRELVFERFFRLNTSNSIAGSGLGLAIVREVARGLDGDAKIHVPDGGQGCLVRIECPYPALA